MSWSSRPSARLADAQLVRRNPRQRTRPQLVFDMRKNSSMALFSTLKRTSIRLRPIISKPTAQSFSTALDRRAAFLRSTMSILPWRTCGTSTGK